MITQADFNNAPTGMTLNDYHVDGSTAGAVVGGVVVHDADGDDTHQFIIDDARFEIVDNDPAPGDQLVLKLKAGIALNALTEPTVHIVVNAYDDDGEGSTNNPYAFDINVDHVNQAPTSVNLTGSTLMSLRPTTSWLER